MKTTSEVRLKVGDKEISVDWITTEGDWELQTLTSLIEVAIKHTIKTWLH